MHWLALSPQQGQVQPLGLSVCSLHVLLHANENKFTKVENSDTLNQVSFLIETKNPGRRYTDIRTRSDDRSVADAAVHRKPGGGEENGRKQLLCTLLPQTSAKSRLARGRGDFQGSTSSWYRPQSLSID